MDKRARAALCLQGWFLVAQTALWALLSVISCDLDNPVLTTYALGIAVVSATALVRRNTNLLSYCFLAAATLWAGSGAALWITGHDIASVFFAFCLAVIHSGFFIMVGCRGVQR